MNKPRKLKATPGRKPALRSAAEARLARSRGKARGPQAKASPELIHELQVHQIELEMQNEELKPTHLALEESRDRYLDFYDFGPVGYFTFTRGGRILEVNLTGAALLGVPRARLLRRGLGSFVAPEDRDRWERHLASVLLSTVPSGVPGEKVSCELKFQREDGSIFHGRLESVWLERADWQESAGAGGGEPIIRTVLSDITERVRAERALEEAHARVVAVLESITDAFFSLDREWCFTHVNRKAERILGLTREQLVGRSIWEMFPPAVGSRFQREYERALAENKTAHSEEFYTPFGKWFEVHVYPSAAGLSVYFDDITERHEAEATLRESEQQLRLVLEESNDAIFWADAATGNIVRCNRKAEELTERSRAELIGMHQTQLHPPDRDQREEFRRAVALGSVENFEAEVLSRTGKRTPVLINTTMVSVGQKKIIQGIFRDVTERKRADETLRKSEAHLRLVLDHSNDAIFWADAVTGTIIRCNCKTEELTELTRDELIGMHVEKLHPPGPDYREIFQRLAAVPSTENVEAEFISRTGKRTPVVVNFSVVTVGREKIVQGIARDVTERKRTEEALRTASEQRRLVLEAAGMGAWDYRFDTGEVFWDEQCRNQWGIAQGEQIGYDTAIAAIHPEDRAATEAAVKQALAGVTGGAYRREFRVVWPDGSIHWVDSHGQVYFEGEGERRRAVRFIGANRDITERKRAEERLRLLSTAVESGGDAVAIADFQGTILWVNPRFAELTGYSQVEVVGQNPRLLKSGQQSAGFYQQMWRTILAGQVWRGELVDRRKDGSLYPVEMTLTPVRAGGSDVTHFIAIMQNITERKRVEEKIRQLNDELELRVQERTVELKQTNENLRQEVEVRSQKEAELTAAELRYRTVANFTYDWEYWTAPDGVLLYCSPSCEHLTGYSAPELIADPKLLCAIVDPEDADIWQQHRHEAVREPGPKTAQFRIRRKDGGLRWVEHVCQPVSGPDGAFLGTRASNRDITERIQAELETQLLRKELAHVTRVTTVGQLTASLAHELNQPLTAISCNAEAAESFLAADQPDLKEVQEALSEIRHDSQRAGAVIQNLRALFKKTGQQRSVLQLNGVIEETLDLLRGELVLNGTSVQLELAPDLPVVLGDRIELQQLVLNLAINALEAMTDLPGPRRRLHVNTNLENPKVIHAFIQDCGAGIPEAQLSRLFEPFFTTKATGMGMGLAICHSIIEAHGGSLWAVNNPDRGATFHFTLPISQGENA